MTFKNFKVLVEKEEGSLKQALRTDDGEEYNSRFCTILWESWYQTSANKHPIHFNKMVYVRGRIA